MALSRTYLLSYGEVALKLGNRRQFVTLLVGNLRQRLKPLGPFDVRAVWGRIVLHTEIPAPALEPVLAATFGLTGFAPVHTSPLRYEDVEAAAVETAGRSLEANPPPATFKIEARRPNKTFPVTSEDLNIRLGRAVQKRYPSLAAKMVRPALTVRVEIREREAYVFPEMLSAGGGLPVGSSGKGLLLLSGGIDSPVAGWMMLKRGMKILPLHFHSPPYTSPRARQKAADLAKSLTRWGGESQALFCPLTDIQIKIKQAPKKSMSTLLTRKAMMEIAEKICHKEGIKALVTGDNLGQVASQTLESLAAVGHGVTRPLFRPLIGFDKAEIITLAQKIGTYETSIRPYDDCCTLFLPPNPQIHPDTAAVGEEYEALDLSSLIASCVEKTEIVYI